MFFNTDIKANLLPRGTLCLTYDDGPGQSAQEGSGPRTLELASYLHEQEIPATFFVLGSHAAKYPGYLGQLSRWKHTIGNHTTSHPGLVGLAASGGDVVLEVARTAELIAAETSPPVVFFRPPYGNWRETSGSGKNGDKPMSIVARVLNGSALARTHVGPINWDISGHDYDYWRQQRSADECAAEYLAEIDRVGRGIVLLHDSSEDPGIRDRNCTFELTRRIIPPLKRLGYRFIALDAIPQVRSAVRVERQIALQAENGRLVTTGTGDGVLRQQHGDWPG